MPVDPATEALIRAAVDASLRKARAPSTRWAVVDSHDALSGQLMVVVDGDEGEPVQANDATGAVFSSGARVLVLYSPPNAIHVIGSRAAPPIPYTPVLTDLDVDDGTLTGEYVVRDGMVDFSVLAVLGTAPSVTGEFRIGLPIEGASSDVVVTDWVTVARASIGAARFLGGAVYQPALDTLSIGGIGSADGGGIWDATEPATWGSGDILRLTGRYPMRLPVQNTDE